MVKFINSLLWKINMLIFKLRFWLIKHSKHSSNMEKYINIEIQHGLIYNDLSPKRCYCGCKEQVEHNHDYLDGAILLEFSVKCKSCGKNLGHWAYGGWQV